jgi:hypothetical protein
VDRKILPQGWAWWFTSVISGTQEAEVVRLWSKASPLAKSETLSENKVKGLGEWLK